MSIAHLADTGLPFNRKERFYTGTVLPMLVCADNFAHFGRLTELAGLGWINVDPRPNSANVQFFTEYNFAESLFGPARERFSGAPTSRETPDVMIYVTGPRRALLAIEAKMYKRPSAAALEKQLKAQAPLVRYLAESLNVAPENVAHVALLPEQLAAEIGPLPFRSIMWERLLATYADVGQAYFVDVLRLALERYRELRASKVMNFGGNAEVELVGADIYRSHREGTLMLEWMGRTGGLYGAKLAKDLATGTWRRQRYQCRCEAAGKPNWFKVAEFVARIDALDPQHAGR